MATNFLTSALPRRAAAALALMLAAALIGCARPMPADDVYYLGTNRVVPAVSVGLGIAG